MSKGEIIETLEFIKIEFMKKQEIAKYKETETESNRCQNYVTALEIAKECIEDNYPE